MKPVSMGTWREASPGAAGGSVASTVWVWPPMWSFCSKRVRSWPARCRKRATPTPAMPVPMMAMRDRVEGGGAGEWRVGRAEGRKGGGTEGRRDGIFLFLLSLYLSSGADETG